MGLDTRNIRGRSIASFYARPSLRRYAFCRYISVGERISEGEIRGGDILPSMGRSLRHLHSRLSPSRCSSTSANDFLGITVSHSSFSVCR